MKQESYLAIIGLLGKLYLSLQILGVIFILLFGASGVWDEISENTRFSKVQDIIEARSKSQKESGFYPCLDWSGEPSKEFCRHPLGFKEGGPFKTAGLVLLSLLAWGVVTAGFLKWIKWLFRQRVS